MALVSECTVGSNVKESIETLSRICMYPLVYSLFIMCVVRLRTSCDKIQYYVQPRKSHREPSRFLRSKPSISYTIAKCCVYSVISVRASLIICFTQSGRTALQLSKYFMHAGVVIVCRMRPACPILAIVKHDQVARKVNVLSSVVAVRLSISGLTSNEIINLYILPPLL